MRVSACEDSSRHKELSFVRHSQNLFCEVFLRKKGDVESNEHDLEGIGQVYLVEKLQK